MGVGGISLKPQQYGLQGSLLQGGRVFWGAEMLCAESPPPLEGSREWEDSFPPPFPPSQGPHVPWSHDCWPSKQSTNCWCIPTTAWQSRTWPFTWQDPDSTVDGPPPS